MISITIITFIITIIIIIRVISCNYIYRPVI